MKKVAITVIMIIAICGSLFGQAKPGGIARQVAMGGSNAGSNLVLNPFIMDDPAMILLNPAYQAMYRDYGWMNISGGSVSGLTGFSNTYDHQNAGVAFGLNADWVVGATLSYDPSAVNVVNTLIMPVGTLGGIAQRNTNGDIPAVRNVWEVVAANHMSSLDWGVGVMYGWSNADSKSSNTSPATSASSEGSSNVWGFRAGVNAPFGSGNSFDASAALHLDKATDKLSNSTGTTAGDYEASGTELQFNARGKFNMSSKFNFVPYGTFITVSAEPKENAFPTGGAATLYSAKYSATAFAFGVGGEFHTSSFYLAGGMSWQSGQVKLEEGYTGPTPATRTTTQKYSAVPVVNVGGEWSFTDWLTGRCGYYRSIGSINYKQEITGSGNTNSFETNNSFPNSLVGIGDMPATTDGGLVTLGLGLKFGGWAMDATVSEEALRRGVGLIGAQDNINTFGYITASYNFATGD